MKIGSKVKVIDGSWSLRLDNKKFERSYGIQLAGREFEVLHTDMKLPSTDDGTFNNTIIKDVNNNEIVFIQERFLREMPKSQPIIVNIEATINPEDINAIKKLIALIRGKTT